MTDIGFQFEEIKTNKRKKTNELNERFSKKRRGGKKIIKNKNKHKKTKDK
jgi:hypothetical protein